MTVKEVGKYSLTYFNLRGRGEAIRYLLHDNCIEYEEITVPSDLSVWAKDWKHKMAFGQVPFFQDGDFQIFQFNSILRHLGRKHDMYGSSDEEKTTIDMLCDGIEDLRKKYTDMIYTNFENGKGPYIEALPKDLKAFENFLKTNDAGNTGFCVGNKTSFLDYNMFDILDIHLAASPSCLDEFPTLKAFHDKMLTRPNISTYRETDGFKTKTINYGPMQ